MSSGAKGLVLDTNVLISAAIFPHSMAARTLSLAFASCRLYRSQETFQEVLSVLNRAKFDRYFVDPVFTRAMFLDIYERYTMEVAVTHVCTECVDPKDNMFLSLAVSAGADIIVSGDKAHVLSMHPYRGIDILSLADFYRLMTQDTPL
ncbi:MAG: putative toxin-antitoxin system toxin component, PIN family [Gammaproteobacteria bacterium]|nr:putative toxin-antitoxin system toxin component, PIN family [Gammaproteobacteria bacterium]